MERNQESGIKNKGKRGFIQHHFSEIKSGAGFTIVEALIGITILATAVTGPMTAAQLGISSSRHARDVLAASMLAQEGVEIVRNSRDMNWLAQGSVDWMQGIMPANPNSNVEYEVSAFTGTIRSCGGGGCPPLYLDSTSHLYGFKEDMSDSPAQPSRFTRSLKKISETDDEMVFEVRVTWTSSSGQQKSYVVQEILTDWYNAGN